MSDPHPDPPRRALVTGGASGFGLAIAQALLAKAAHVAVGDVDSLRLQEAQQTLRGSNVLFLDLDVTSSASIRKAISGCQEHVGGLDTLVNSAGVIRCDPLIEITEEEWDLGLDVNLKGAFLCSQAASPLLCASGRGRIVNIGSAAAQG